MSGAAAFKAARWEAQAARRIFEHTRAPVLRQVRETAWAYAQQHATECAMRLWKALLAKLRTTYPEASDGQLWVLLRDKIRALSEELRVLDADGL